MKSARFFQEEFKFKGLDGLDGSLQLLEAPLRSVLPGDRPLAGIYHDANGGIAVRLCVSDVGFLHELRDIFLGSTGRIDRRLQEALRSADLIGPDAHIEVDASHFAETYGSSVLRLDKLTPHQTEKLRECLDHRLVEFKAAAGAGKTFVALHLMQQFLEQEQDSVPSL